MGAHEELGAAKAVAKLKDLVKHQGACMMVTRTVQFPSNSRPMHVAEVDEDGNLCFLTLSTSRKYADLVADPRVDLYFTNPADQEFLTVHGRGELHNDKARIKELWNPLASAWVPEGVEDPSLCLLKVVPEEGYYWDTKDGKIVAMVKIGWAALTGRTGDDGGVQGKLHV